MLAFQKIYKRSPLTWPKMLQVDPGREFMGAVTKEMENIYIYIYLNTKADITILNTIYDTILTALLLITFHTILLVMLLSILLITLPTILLITLPYLQKQLITLLTILLIALPTMLLITLRYLPILTTITTTYT